MDGILVINKPADFTSFDCIAIIRGVSGQRKIGHTGTLDPNATGVLPVCFGSAAKLIEYMDAQSKSYLAGGRLGICTDTQDIWGNITGSCAPDFSSDSFSRENIESCLKSFEGDILQVPPAYSAVHVNGVKAYKLAREGQEVSLPPRRVRVDSIELRDYDRNTGDFVISVSCGRGTYIRTIIKDLGDMLSCGACMTSLIRTGACGFGLSDAVELSEVRRMTPAEIEARLLPPGSGLVDMERLQLPEELLSSYQNGMTVICSCEGFIQNKPLAVFRGDRLIGISKFLGNALKPVKIFR